MKTLHVGPGTADASALVGAEIDRLIADGKRVVVTVAEVGEWLFPQQVCARLGCSPHEVESLIAAGEIEALSMGDPRFTQVSLGSVLAFEARRESARRRSGRFSGLLSTLGAPAGG